jgi:alpha/beta superfamily hydrolase
MAVGMNDDRVVRLISIGTPVDKYGDFDFLTDARKPILFLHGDSDEFGGVENLRALYERVVANTDAELKVFENCGHFFDDDLNELRDVVREWVERQTEES